MEVVVVADWDNVAVVLVGVDFGSEEVDDFSEVVIAGVDELVGLERVESAKRNPPFKMDSTPIHRFSRTWSFNVSIHASMSFIVLVSATAFTVAVGFVGMAVVKVAVLEGFAWILE